MARKFDTTTWLDTATPPVAGYPCTFACRFITNDAAGFQELISLHNSSSGANRNALDLTLGGSGNNFVLRARRCDSGANTNADSIQRYYPGVWNHAAAVFASSTNHEAYLNGVKGVTPLATARVLSGINSLGLGLSPGVAGSFLNGMLADVAIWSVDLSAAEVRRLASGEDPRRIRSAALTLFRLRGNGYGSEVDASGVYILTNNGTIAVAHPPEINYSARRWLAGVNAYSFPQLIYQNQAVQRASNY